MRDLSATNLLVAQRADHLHELIKLDLTSSGLPTYQYLANRILRVSHIEQPYSQTAMVVLNNSDLAVTANLMGYKAVISYGLTTSTGDEYSACAPLYVRPSPWRSTPNSLIRVLHLWGIPDLIAQDTAITDYLCPSTNTDTIKTHIINLITNLTGAGAVFGDCASYTCTWEASCNGNVILDVLILKDSFRIYRGESRLAVLKRLLGYTNVEMRVQNDGVLHFFVPGTSIFNEYKIEVTDFQNFQWKTYNPVFVQPNYIEVIEPGANVAGAVKTQVTTGATSVVVKGLTPAIWLYAGALMTIAGIATTFTLTGTVLVSGAGEATVSFTPALATGETAIEDAVVTISATALYYGYAQDTTSSAFKKVARKFYVPVVSTAQAGLVATAILTKFQLYSPKGQALVRQHCGQETGDYVIITDSRENDVLSAHVGYLRRDYSPRGSWLSLVFGNGDLGGVDNIRSLTSPTTEEVYNWAGDNFEYQQGSIRVAESNLTRLIERFEALKTEVDAMTRPWIDLFPSDFAASAIITAGGTDVDLPSVTLPALPAGCTLTHAYLMVFYSVVTDTSAVVNSLNGAQNIIIKISTAAWGDAIAAINLQDGQMAVPASGERGGTPLVGDIDIKAIITAATGTYNIRISLADAIGNNLVLKDVQCFIKLVGTV